MPGPLSRNLQNKVCILSKKKQEHQSIGVERNRNKKKQRLDGIMLIRDPLLPKVSKRIRMGVTTFFSMKKKTDRCYAVLHPISSPLDTT